MDEVKNLGMSPLPKLKAVDLSVPEPLGYEFVLQFNEKAELVNINYPSDLNIAQVSNHLVVALLFLAEKIVASQSVIKPEPASLD